MLEVSGEEIGRGKNGVVCFYLTRRTISSFSMKSKLKSSRRSRRSRRDRTFVFFVCFSYSKELRGMNKGSSWEEFFGVGRGRTRETSRFHTVGSVEEFREATFFISLLNVFRNKENTKVKKGFVVFDITSHMFREPSIEEFTDLGKTSFFVFLRTTLKDGCKTGEELHRGSHIRIRKEEEVSGIQSRDSGCLITNPIKKMGNDFKESPLS